MTNDEILRKLLGPGINSETMVWPFIQLLDDAWEGEEFWQIFHLGWNMCDNTWAARNLLTDMLDNYGTGIPYHDDKNRDFYDGLPDPFRIYRGCSRQRVLGLAWTTDPAVAAGFAGGHRGIPVGDAVVASALISKEDVFTVTTDREESEVVVDWRLLRQLSTTPVEAPA